MFVQEIIIDGFKSYAHRTVVEGFDPHFNAITGLNGSGKSNILDAICFVLGITNLSQVRAGNLSELVYKQGQAGVNKATVTIVFNNEDEKNSPVGYEQCHEVTVTRQVLIGGKSKYMINGRNAPANQVQNLFHSVQLNVNNPHFLIMQGRITKVLNMKPNEILGMIEEAAGTRMYETKRVTALKTIDKKQLKLDELNRVLSEDITPTLNRLRDERENYLRWSKIDADIQRDERFVIAYEFTKAQKTLDVSSEGSAGIEEKIAAFEKKAQEIKAQIHEKEKEIEERVSEMKGELDDQYSEAKKVESELSKKLVKVTSNWKNTQTLVAQAEEDVSAATSAVNEAKDAVTSKEKEIKTESSRIEDKIRDATEAEEKFKNLEQTFQNMNAGISSSEGDQASTLPEQISKAHSDSKTAEGRVKQAKMRISHLNQELKKAENEVKKQGSASDKLSKKKESAIKKVEKIKADMKKIDFDSDRFNALENEKSDLDNSISELRELVDTLSAKLQGRLSFQYSDPVRGFDRSKVKGLVAKLIQVNDSKYSTALEVVAGGKLYQVVVDEAITGKALLERGKLKRRVTIIPLDKIKSRQVPASAADRAKEIAKEFNSTAQPAIELVGYDEEIRNAIEYVFGASIVVDGMKAANQICDATKTRTVTLDGDVYDPSGTISGGSKNQLGSTLSTLAELNEASSKLSLCESRLADVLKEHNHLSKSSSSYETIASKLDIAEAELQAVEKHLSQTSFGMLIESRDKMAKELKEAQEECVAMEKEQQEKWSLYNELKEKETELTQEREDRLAELERAVKDAKADAAAKTKIAREIGSLSQTLAIELENLKVEVAAAEESVSIAQKALNQALEEESMAQMKVGEVESLYDDAKENLNSLEAIRTERSSVLVSLKNEKSDLIRAHEEATLEAKKLSVVVSRMAKDKNSAEKVVAAMMKQHPWIQSDMKTFGVAGSNYDFAERDPEELSKTLQSLRNEHEKLSKSVNKKVMGMFDKASDEYKELLRKRKVVESDKKKIQDVIHELDEKKKAELEQTWVKVNRDFGSIFSTLLPGAFAKLEPPEGMEVWEGLEVKVAFGDVWKESLSELSGGQRSLLALSLILSLLLFKPAPMYILDEVDAALDLSHTQNIGNMLKTHFSQSQFIVVSLKEGMFNNANVIFRTKFVEGVSTVTRTIGTGSSRARLLGASENQPEHVDASTTKTERSRASSSRRGKENA